MADPTGVHNDGNIPFGSQVVTIGEESYIMASGNLSMGSNQVVSNNEVGVPRGQVFTATVPTGSAELQFEDATQKPPALFATFSITLPGGDSVTAIITEVGPSWANGDEKKCSINIAKKIAETGGGEGGGSEL